MSRVYEYFQQFKEQAELDEMYEDIHKSKLRDIIEPVDNKRQQLKHFIEVLKDNIAKGDFAIAWELIEDINLDDF